MRSEDLPGKSVVCGPLDNGSKVGSEVKNTFVSKMVLKRNRPANVCLIKLGMRGILSIRKLQYQWLALITCFGETSSGSSLT